MQKLSVEKLEVGGQRVLVRVDFNVPMKGEGSDLVITDDTRVRAALPTIRHLREKGAKVILMSHLGRPKGQVNPKFSLAPVAAHLGGLLGVDVGFATDCVGDAAATKVAAMKDGDVLVLENVRFHAEEEANSPAFAAELAKLGDCYVNDAFGTAHRAHASTEGVARLLPQAAAGFLMQRELKYLMGELAQPAKPFVVIMGGSKVSDKIQVITRLLEKADVMLVGGAMAHTFRKAQGLEVGESRVEADKLELALGILEEAEKQGVKFLLPADVCEAEKFEDGVETRSTRPYRDGGGVTPGWQALDIGEVAIGEFREEILKARTIVWNGPVGVFEFDSFAAGTKAVAEAVAEATEKGAVSIIGGGDSVTAVNNFGLADKMTFISTGGGASLELMEGRELPGVAALTDA